MNVALLVLAGILANFALTGVAILFVLRRLEQRHHSQVARTRAIHESLLGKIAQLETALARESNSARQAEQNLSIVLKSLTTRALREDGEAEAAGDPQL